MKVSGTIIQTKSRITDGAIIMRASERVCCVAIIPSLVEFSVGSSDVTWQFGPLVAEPVRLAEDRRARRLSPRP